MLRQRVITATILLVVVLATLYLAPSWAWGLLSAGALWFAGREWERLILPGASPGDQRFPWLASGLVVAALACLVWRESTGYPAGPGWEPGLNPDSQTGLEWGLQSSLQSGFQSGLLVVDLLLWLLLAVPAVFRARPFRFGARSFAAVSLFCLWLGLYELRRLDPTLLLSTMAIIWAADVGAYFFGRAFGRHKLAPRVSPGKSWEGAIGGLVLVLVLSLAAVAWLPAGGATAFVFPTWLAGRAGLATTVLVLVTLVALSIVGDLHESLLKRARGVKDSGRLFPGHGGMLDRIDALVPTMPLALFVVQALSQRP